MSLTKQVQQYGQSLWQDYIQRSELLDGKLARMIAEDGIRGVTSNPAIFQKAISDSRDYDERISELARSGENAEGIYRRLTVEDIKQACRIMREVFRQSDGADGFVSLEVNPQLAYKTQESIAEAKELFAAVGEPNLMIKVPGTSEGISTVRALIADGINVNVTLLFSPRQYENAAVAYIEGLQERARRGRELAGVNSVASFFLSRIDTQVDKRLDELFAAGKIDKATLESLRGEAAVAVAKVTYRRFEELFFSPRFKALQAKGARLQRPLWASTGTKDPAYSDVKYVEALIGPHTVNTLPPATIEAFRDHGKARNTLTNDIEQAPRILARLQALGIDLEAIYGKLQSAGVSAFEQSYLQLLQAIAAKAQQLGG